MRLAVLSHDLDVDAVADLETGRQRVGGVVVLDDEVVRVRRLDAGRVEAQVAVADHGVVGVVEHDAAVRLLVGDDVDHLVAVGVEDDHAGVAVAVHHVVFDEVVVRSLVDARRRRRRCRGWCRRARCCAWSPRAATPPSLSSCGSVGMPWILLPSIWWPSENWRWIASPRLPSISLFRTMLFGAAAETATPTSLSSMMLLWIVLPLRPSSASKNSMPATACAATVRFLDDGVRGAAGQQHAVAELLDGAVADDDVGVAADADAGREALPPDRRRCRRGSRGRRSCGRSGRRTMFDAPMTRPSPRQS